MNKPDLLKFHVQKEKLLIFKSKYFHLKMKLTRQNIYQSDELLAHGTKAISKQRDSLKCIFMYHIVCLRDWWCVGPFAIIYTI